MDLKFTTAGDFMKAQTKHIGVVIRRLINILFKQGAWHNANTTRELSRLQQEAAQNNCSVYDL